MRDTFHFVERLMRVHQPLDEDIILVSAEVSSLYEYINICHGEDVDAIRNVLTFRPNDTHVSTDF